MDLCTPPVDSKRVNEVDKENGNEDTEDCSISKIRCGLAQYLATLAASCLTLSMGMSIGFSTILIPELYKKDAEIVVTLAELTWLSSMNFILITVGALLSGMLTQWLGRRFTIILLTIPYMASMIILHYSTNAAMLFIAFTLTGLAGGLAEAPTQTYVTEIGQPIFRGSLSATISMTIMGGLFMQFVMGSYIYWRKLVLINLIFPIMCFLAMLLVPESPYWLADKKRFTESERALAWVRGWTTPYNTRHEYKAMLESIQKSPRFNNYRDNNVQKYKKDLKEIAKPYFRRTVYLPFAQVSFAFFISCFNGDTAILIYAILLFEKLKSPINEYTATMIMGLLKVLASTLMIVLIHYTGKRILTFVSLIGTALSLLTVAIYSFLNDYYQIDVQAYSWIPTVMILIAIFASTIGIKSIPWVISGEVFPADVRSVANGFVSSTCYIYSAIATKTFLYMIEGITMAGTFLFFTLINVFGFVVLYFILPETEGRTLKEIQDHYSGTKNLNDRQANKFGYQVKLESNSTV